MTSSDIRKAYIDFFVKKGHKEIAPSPLVPENDPTTLFTSSGMQPLVPYLLGEKHPQGTRLVDSQRSFRAQDIEEVGDNRHTTFFEMLGNWSLGDYFKKEQLRWFFEFLTKVLKLDHNKLYISVFEGSKDVPKDEETANIWKELGIPNDRIFYYPALKNWWSRSGPPEKMPVGEPGGPDSEVFYDLGTEHNNAFGKSCHPNCDCGRFLEIGNSVFMEYKKTESGVEKLSQKNVDFGGGLERLSMAVANESDIFRTDIFSPIIKEIEKTSGKNYSDSSNQKAMRIISDHLKASVFMIADGVLPSNKTQGYTLRRLIRRSIVYCKDLAIINGLDIIRAVVPAVVNIYKDYYSYLSSKQQQITLVLEEEALRFSKTLEKGLREIEKTPNIDGKTAFKIYETFGFPWEMTQELVNKRGDTINRVEFEREFEKHKQLSRSTSSGMFKGGLADHSVETTKLHTATHLLHAALRKVLGIHVAQKGSHITDKRLRFDFSHPQKMTDIEIKKVEEIVNEQIKKNLPVTFTVMTYKDAVSQGALAFFSERYQDKVKVYTIGPEGGWFSKEVCGGPHVDFTSMLGGFRIIKEESAASGVRRIYAVVNN